MQPCCARLPCGHACGSRCHPQRLQHDVSRDGSLLVRSFIHTFFLAVTPLAIAQMTPHGSDTRLGLCAWDFLLF